MGAAEALRAELWQNYGQQTHFWGENSCWGHSVFCEVASPVSFTGELSAPSQRMHLGEAVTSPEPSQRLGRRLDN